MEAEWEWGLTEEVDGEAAVAEAAGGAREEGAALRAREVPPPGRRHAAGVRVGVAEVEQHRPGARAAPEPGARRRRHSEHHQLQRHQQRCCRRRE